MSKIFRILFPKNSSQLVERNCKEKTTPDCLVKGDATIRTARLSLEYDVWVTQYNEVVVSERAARAIERSKLSGVLLGRPVEAYLNGKPAGIWRQLAPRNCVGFVSESARLTISKFSHGVFAFRFQQDPPWGDNPDDYKNISDVFQIWPFYRTIFATESFVNLMECEKLKGFHFLPFEASSSTPKGYWQDEYQRGLNLGEPFSWMSIESRRELWKSVARRAGKCPGLPAVMPANWYNNAGESAEKTSKPSAFRPDMTSSMTSPEAEWRKTSLFASFPRSVKTKAFEYLKSDYSGSDTDEWKKTDLVWGGDAAVGGRVMRRWRAMMLYPSEVWVIYELTKESGRYFAVST